MTSLGGHKNKKICKNQMKYVKWLFNQLHIPTNPTKGVGPIQHANILVGHVVKHLKYK